MTQRNQIGMSAGTFVAGALAGGSLAWLFDSSRGRRRRMLLRDATVHATHVVTKTAEKTSRDMGNRARGILAAGRSFVQWGFVSDDVLVQRIRARLGRVVSHPDAIQVQSRNGHATLFGPVLEEEVNRLLSQIRAVRGVKGLENHLEIHKEVGKIPDLQPRTSRPWGPRSEWTENWSPATRLVLGSAGAALVGLSSRRRASAIPLAVAGGAILFRTITNKTLLDALGLDHDRHGIEIQKTTYIHAPVEDVFAFWSHPENFSLIMPHVKEVKNSDGCYHWTVTGLAGLPISWNAAITKNEPNRVISWKSEPGSTIRNAGAVRFDSVNDGTRVHLRMSYNAVGGVISHSLASLIGADPKSALDEAMVRLKSLFEKGKTTTHHHTVTREQMNRRVSAAPSTTNSTGNLEEKNTMNVREVMTPNPVCCLPEDTAQSVAKIMCESNVGSVPVITDKESQKLTGIVTDRDLCCTIIAQGLNPATTVRPFIRQNPVACRPDDDLESCERAMQKYQVRRIPVVDQQGRCVGIVAQADIALALDPQHVYQTVAEISRTRAVAV